ncbi:SDR family NAD(P)-dependent oxidoreductase [Comamonas odontotermitis]|uniref:SDR family NAD(P)-dependent oxidoreductase n=1 Tax=Comamonas odontotermitis TaxID=379895 RepID=UPI0037529EE9
MNLRSNLLDLAGPVPVFAPAARLAGHICLVMGATSGIGQATALRMADEGAAAVVVTGRRQELGLALAQEIRHRGSNGLFLACDVTREAEIADIVAQVTSRFGRLDVAFNNAGFQERRAPLAKQDDAVYTEVFDTNVRAIFHAMRHEIVAMQASGGGAIVNNASVSGIRNPNPGLSLYGASKAAVISLTRAAAMEYAKEGIRINAIAPGRVVTDMMLSSGIADMNAVAAGLPLGRMGHPQEVAAALVWLASNESGFVVGHCLAVDGGFLAG